MASKSETKRIEAMKSARAVHVRHDMSPLVEDARKIQLEGNRTRPLLPGVIVGQASQEDDCANAGPTKAIGSSIEHARTALGTTDRIRNLVAGLHARLLGKPDAVESPSRPMPEGEVYQLAWLLGDLNESLDRLFDEVDRLHQL